MIWKVATYRVREGEVDAVLAVVARFVAAVAREEPDTVYDAWQEEDDPLSFVHLMGFADPDAEQRHREAPYTEELVASLYPRCSEEPTFRPLRRVAPTSGAAS